MYDEIQSYSCFFGSKYAKNMLKSSLIFFLAQYAYKPFANKRKSDEL